MSHMFSDEQIAKGYSFTWVIFPPSQIPALSLLGEVTASLTSTSSLTFTGWVLALARRPPFWHDRCSPGHVPAKGNQEFRKPLQKKWQEMAWARDWPCCWHAVVLSAPRPGSPRWRFTAQLDLRAKPHYLFSISLNVPKSPVLTSVLPVAAARICWGGRRPLAPPVTVPLFESPEAALLTSQHS